MLTFAWMPALCYNAVSQSYCPEIEASYSKSTESSDRIVKGNVDLDGFGDKIFDLKTINFQFSEFGRIEVCTSLSL
jgi:hypothetical protein